MKHFFKLPALLFLTLALVLSSCQKEEDEFIDETDIDTITANSTLTDLLRSAAQNQGDLDDLIDGSSCLTIEYPIDVIANGQKLTLESEEDIELVEQIFDQFPNDEDTLQIIFPITVSLEDFTLLTVNSQSELDDLIAACENSISDTFACVDFVYPITVFTYNENNEQTGTVTFNSDEEWLLFLITLDPGVYFTIDYPISLIINGSTVQVNDNQELLTAIQQADCDTSGGGTTNDFETLATTGTWYVTYFFDDLDETSDFADYEFTFATDGSAEATNTAGTTNGTWDYYTDSGVEKFELFFGTNDPLDELDEDWEILEATEEIIRLRDESGDGSIDYLTFERTPYTGGGGGTTNAFIQELTNGSWYVNLLEDDGQDETCDYEAYEFTYNTNGTVTAVSASNTVNGFWAVNNDSSGLDLVLNFDITGEDDPFEDLNDDWDVSNYTAQLIELVDVSGGGGGTDFLNFGRDPYTGCSGGTNAQALIDTLQNGPWFVSQYLDDGVDETNDYNGYNVTFTAGGTVTATNGANTFNGTWSVTGTSDLDLVLDFGTQIPFDEFNDDWDVLNFTSTQINLEDVSGGGGGTDNLTFQKL